MLRLVRGSVALATASIVALKILTLKVSSVLTTAHLAGVVSVADGGDPRQPLAVHRLHLEAAREGGGLAGAEDVVGGGEPDVHDLEGGAAAGRALHLGSDM